MHDEIPYRYTVYNTLNTEINIYIYILYIHKALCTSHKEIKRWGSWILTFAKPSVQHSMTQKAPSSPITISVGFRSINAYIYGFHWFLLRFGGMLTQKKKRLLHFHVSSTSCIVKGNLPEAHFSVSVLFPSCESGLMSSVVIVFQVPLNCVHFSTISMIFRITGSPLIHSTKGT